MSTCTSTPATPTPARCAVRLVALARAGYVETVHLHALGRVLLGRDLNAPQWRLARIGKIRPRPGLVAAALRAALTLSFTPRRVRLGVGWVKDGSGQVAECLPADLPPAALTQYLRAATFGLIRSGTPAPLQPMQEAPLPDGFETSESPFASEYSNRLAMGPEEVLIASQTLDGMLRLATDRERLVVQMRIEGYGAVEIAQRLGVTDRTVRRCLQALRERATKAGVIDPPPAVPSRAATDDRGARMAKATRVA